MKINYNCLRSTLLCIEESLSHTKKYIGPEDIFGSDYCSGYSKDDVINCIQFLKDDEMITASLLYGCGELTDFAVSGITSKGCEFLEKAQDQKFWKKLTNHIESAGISLGIGSFFQFTMNFK